MPPKGGNKLHNQCADGIPFNAYRGANALVNGKAFDGLQAEPKLEGLIVVMDWC